MDLANRGLIEALVLFWTSTSVSGLWAVHCKAGREVLYLSYRYSQDVPEECNEWSSAHMFADPLSLTIAGSAKTFNKVTVEGSKVVYSTATGDYTLTISHTRGKRKRSVFRLDAKKVAADPLLAERNVETNQAAYLVLDSTTNGLYSSTEQVDLIAALSATLTANTNALATKMVNGEL